MTARASAFVVAALIALPLFSGCGSSGSGTTAGGSQQQTSGAATVKASSGSLGTILVDGNGRTIYLFAKDSGPISRCSGACLANWPAVTTHGAPQAGGGVTASKLGSARRGDGTTQVTYAGHPLYTYSGDGAAGDTNGQGVDAFGARWYVLAPSGAEVTGSGSGGDGGDGGGAY